MFKNSHGFTRLRTNAAPSVLGPVIATQTSEDLVESALCIVDNNSEPQQHNRTSTLIAGTTSLVSTATQTNEELVESAWRYEPTNITFVQPRYIGDITLEAVRTPRRAKRTIQFINNEFVKCRNKIKVLQKQNVKMHKKVTSLKEIMTHLKKKN
ncbi:hypothetical protein ABEB36_015609 [Hypothenemus hampei]|uniref:Uncharacterized protein n=1 Tax=Hypothenemus hampei TaxID=57062 RepID=A0ABD1DZ79_HYPHA